MPLTRAGENGAATMNGVRFVMLDGFTEVACRADSDLLRDLYASSGEGSGDFAAFNKYRSIIEQAASAKYDAGNIATGEVTVVVSKRDIASHLSLKFG